MKEKKKKFYISFSSENRNYFAGKDIVGAVCLDTDDNINLKKITIKFFAEGKASFSVYNKTRRTNKTVEDKFVYLEREFVLLNEANSKTFTPGLHRFDFSYSLANNLPSSFEGEHGYVTYYCKAKVEKSAFFSTKMEAKEIFNVISLYDLNSDPRAMEPINKQLSRTIGRWLCTSGNFELQLHIGQTGYLSGENIIINGSFNNQTSASFEKCKIRLQQVVNYTVGSYTKPVEKTILTQAIKTISPGEEYIFDSLPLCLPALPPSAMPFCKMIDIQYCLMFKFSPSGFYREHTFNIPIIIGTTREQPVVQSFQLAAQPPMPYPHVSPPFGEGVLNHGFGTYPPMPSPLYPVIATPEYAAPSPYQPLAIESLSPSAPVNPAYVDTHYQPMAPPPYQVFN